MSKVPEKEKGILESLDDFWFGHGSPTSLGVFRIIMGALITTNLIMILIDWETWFSERGYVPAWLGRIWMSDRVQVLAGSDLTLPRVDVLNGVVNPWIALAIYLATILAGIFTTIGLWTRVSSILLAVGLVSIHHRNPIILHGGDTVMRVMALYIAIAPSGLACSVDRLIRLWKGRDTGAPIQVSLWPQRLIMYNMALIYFTTIWLKWFGNLWKEGTATWFPSRLAEFYRFPYPEFMRDTPMVQITTYGTLIVEFALATLVFYRPFRKYVLIAGVLLHGWIEYSMNIPLFSYLMVSMYVTFYEGEEISAWFQRLGKRFSRFRATVDLPAGQQLDGRGAAFFDAVDPLKIVTYVNGESPTLESAEVRRSWTHSLGAWLFAWVPGVWRRLMEAALVSSQSQASDETAAKPRAKVRG